MRRLCVLLAWVAASRVLAALGPPEGCSDLTSCELYSELQQHSKRIAGFSYNVKKADAALTELSHQHAVISDRVDRLYAALRRLEEGVSEDTAVRQPTASGDELAVSGDWEKAAARELARLGDWLTKLRHHVNTDLSSTLRNNSDEVEELRSTVQALNQQVEDLEAQVRIQAAETEELRRSNPIPKISPGSSGDIPHGEGEGSENVTIVLPAPDDWRDPENTTTEPSAPGPQETQVEIPSVPCEERGGTSVDSLGIELETVQTVFDTLHAQVTELQARCNNKGEELDRLVESLEQRLTDVATFGNCRTRDENKSTPSSSSSSLSASVTPPSSTSPSASPSSSLLSSQPILPRSSSSSSPLPSSSSSLPSLTSSISSSPPSPILSSPSLTTGMTETETGMTLADTNPKEEIRETVTLDLLQISPP